MKYLITFNEMIGSGNHAEFHNKSGEKFWGNCGAGLLVCTKDTGKILLAFRSEGVNEPHTYNLIGGKIDEEEGQSESNIEDVAKREFIEETGYSGKIELIPAYIFETPNKSFKYYNFIGLIDNEFNPQIDWETEYFKWVTFDEMMKIEPKHFGLKALLNDTKSLSIIKKYSK